MKKIELKQLIKETINEAYLTPLMKQFLTINGTKKFGKNTPEYKKLEIIGDNEEDWENWIDGAANFGIIVTYDHINDVYIVKNKTGK